MKEFYQKHKKAIANFAWMAVGVAAGACAMNVVSNHRGILVTNKDVKKILVDSTHEGAVLEDIPCVVISIPKKTFKSEGVVEMAVCDKKDDNNEIWSNWFSTILKMIQL